MMPRVQSIILANRRGISIAVHLALGAIAFILAFMLRFDFAEIPFQYADLLLKALPIAVGIKGVAVIHFGLTSGLWR
ncbi:MAG: hypothetical protein HN341_09085 [Verrucomicrobia bacterium]|jgi:hypothetical protein|nr:hypothetical protein [Verrucomicrobiota bacterium]